jgi:ribosome-associated protein
MHTIEIQKEPVELYKILKFEGMTSTGGEAKLLIGDGQVTVNGETETRRRRKMVNGDVIGFRGDQFQLQLTTNSEGPVA